MQIIAVFVISRMMYVKNPLVLARPAGIEPATLGFGGQYSIH